jgi:hypothetical protein
MTKQELITDALRAWVTTYPRRATKYQHWVTSLPEAVELVAEAEDDPQNWPFISTYSFPHGHTKDDAIPRIDRLFFDFDVPDTGEYRGGKKHAEAWARDMSRLLVRTRKVAKFLLNGNDPGCWQAVLSGHKGVHLDLVFPAVSPANGDFQQFRNGMGSYADSVVDYLKDATDLDDLDTWVDVSSADLGRLRRVPNTKHLGATKAFEEDRFCVPVTLRELAGIGPADYIELTRSRRPVTDSMEATPNETAGDVLTQRVRNATTTARSTSSGSSVDRARIDAYEKAANDSITVDSLPFLMSDRPCVLEFIERDDAFSHRSASHVMEMFVITNMIEKDVPISIMIDYFNQHPRSNESYTRTQIEQFISRDYSPVSCEKIWHQADQFCLKEGCKIWNDAELSEKNK